MRAKVAQLNKTIINDWREAVSACFGDYRVMSGSKCTAVATNSMILITLHLLEFGKRQRCRVTWQGEYASGEAVHLIPQEPKSLDQALGLMYEHGKLMIPTFWLRPWSLGAALEPN